jgi:N-acetylmuramic acid 6-phosphate etherase
MVTEDVDPRVADLDAWPLTSAMEAMWEGQLAAVAAVGRAIPAITAATNAASQALGDRGRLIYVGAGTSGRIAVQDGAELMPTFAWSQERLGFIIVGGESAFAASAERRGRRCRRCNQTDQCCTALAVRRGDRGVG